MSPFQRISRAAVAAAVLALPLTTTSVLAQTAPLSYAVPDAGAWSDILKNNPKTKAAPAKKAERKSAAPTRQAKAKPANSESKSEAREAFASAPPQQSARPADVRIVSPDEFNEIDQMAGQ